MAECSGPAPQGSGNRAGNMPLGSGGVVLAGPEAHANAPALGFLPPELSLWRQHLYDTADGMLPGLLRFLGEHGLDHRTVLAHCGILTPARVVFLASDRFDFDPEDGVPAIVCEVLGQDGETVVDLAAWPQANPAHVATALGVGPAFGLWQIDNPASFIGGAALRVWRTPLRWLQAGCQGCCVLNRRWGGNLLAQAPGPILAEDLAHGRDLRRLMPRRFDLRRLLVPTPVGRDDA